MVAFRITPRLATRPVALNRSSSSAFCFTRAVLGWVEGTASSRNEDEEREDEEEDDDASKGRRSRSYPRGSSRAAAARIIAEVAEYDGLASRGMGASGDETGDAGVRPFLDSPIRGDANPPPFRCASSRSAWERPYRLRRPVISRTSAGPRVVSRVIAASSARTSICPRAFR